MNWLDAIVQLGVAGFALYILWDLIKRHNRRIDERDKAFKNYANEHNHKMTDLIVACKEQIQESTKAIKSLYNKKNR